MNVSDSQRYLLAFLLAPLGCSLLFVFYPKLILPVFLVTLLFTVFLGLPIKLKNCVVHVFSHWFYSLLFNIFAQWNG